MLALRFHAPEDVRLEEVPEPDCGPDEVKLRVRNCSTCGTDVKIFHNGHQNLTPPRTIGHEVAGEVVEVGAEVNATYGTDWVVGDRAQVIAAVPCGECHECRKGWMAVCQNQTSVGYQYDGGFAEYMVVPREVLRVDGLNRIPDGVEYDEASAAEPFACAINAQEQLGIEPGGTVVIFGAGPIGCMHIRIARGVHDVGAVYLVDVNAERLTMSAEAVHPDEVIDASQVDVVQRVLDLTGGRGADVVITATAANVTQEQAIAMAARNGRISFFGGLPKTDPDHHLRLQIGALPPAAHPRRQRLRAGAQQARARVHRLRAGPRQGPDHRAPAAGPGPRGVRRGQGRRGDQGDRGAMTGSSQCTFSSARGVELAARLERPLGPVRGTAVFAHCFKGSKDLRMERQITAALARTGLAVLSFDFAGLGRSGGDFADSTFAADVADLVAATDYLGEAIAPPVLLVGHSLGGAAVLSIAASVASVRAVATIGAPADPAHVEHVLDGDLESVRRDGSGEVTIAGRTFTIGRAFLEHLEQGEPKARIAEFRGATLLMHSPVDETVGIDNAEELYRAARHPKSFVSLDDADHLLTDPAEAAYVAGVVAGWAERYLPSEPVAPADSEAYDADGATARNDGGFLTTVTSRGHELVADEPAEVGGSEQGPAPYDFLAAALGMCTVMTMRAYAERRGWDVGGLEATVSHDRVHAEDCRECEHTDGQIDRLHRVLHLPDGLTEEQRATLVRIADRCPVHRTLEGQLEVHTSTRSR